MHAVVTTAPELLRADLTGLYTKSLAARASRFRPGDPTTPTAAARRTLRVLGRRWLALSIDIDKLDTDLDQLTATTAPTLRNLPSVGPQNASALLIAAGDNPDRLATEVSYAAQIMRCLKPYVARQIHRAIASDLRLHQPRSAPVELAV